MTIEYNAHGGFYELRAKGALGRAQSFDRMALINLGLRRAFGVSDEKEQDTDEETV